MMLIRGFCTWALLAIFLMGGYAIARATQPQELAQPAAGLCYATDSTQVETTALYSNSPYYPIVQDVTVEHVDAGFVVTHRALFEFRGTRTYLSQVVR